MNIRNTKSDKQKKEAQRERQKRYYRKHKERINKRRKLYHQQVETRRKIQQRYYRRNKEHIINKRINQKRINKECNDISVDSLIVLFEKLSIVD